MTTKYIINNTSFLILSIVLCKSFRHIQGQQGYLTNKGKKMKKKTVINETVWSQCLVWQRFEDHFVSATIYCSCKVLLSILQIHQQFIWLWLLHLLLFYVQNSRQLPFLFVCLKCDRMYNMLLSFLAYEYAFLWFNFVLECRHSLQARWLSG